MAQRRAHQNEAPRAAHTPFAPARATLAGLLPPGLARQTPQELLDALPERLGRYIDLLSAWNSAINLTGARGPEDILERLIPDSFHLAAFLRSAPLAGAWAARGAEGPRVWDLGAGAGLPGIPLRLVWEEGDYTLVEVREKRALFLANALAGLGLPRTRVFRGPAERLFAAQPHGADILLSRAFMPWQKLLDFCRPGLAPGGTLVILAAGACGRLPAPWELLAEADYVVNGKQRWFWALREAEGAHREAHRA